MTEPVVVVPGRGRVSADTPLLRADDLGVLRGDGVFESTHVRGGEPWLLTEHLTRMAHSAARIRLDLPAEPELRELARQACEGWPADREGRLRLVCTRGPESGGPPTVYATLNEVGAAVREARRRGVAIATAELGVTATVRSGAPWLLGDIKGLSYAVNMATLRWAAEQGFDDVLWVSADGFALEAPTAGLVWQAGDRLCTVPSDTTHILPSITVRWLLDHAGELGLRPAERMVGPAELTGCDGVWLVSSVRGAVAVRAIDGSELKESAATAAMQDLLGHPR